MMSLQGSGQFQMPRSRMIYMDMLETPEATYCGQEKLFASDLKCGDVIRSVTAWDDEEPAAVRDFLVLEPREDGFERLILATPGVNGEKRRAGDFGGIETYEDHGMAPRAFDGRWWPQHHTVSLGINVAPVLFSIEQVRVFDELGTDVLVGLSEDQITEHTTPEQRVLSALISRSRFLNTTQD